MNTLSRYRGRKSPARTRIQGMREAGFSLAEILLAMAVAALLMTMLLSILSKSMDVSKRNNAGMISKSSAQAALDMMAVDLDSIAMGRNLGEVLRCVATNGTGSGSSLTNTTLYVLSTSMQDSYSTNASGNPGCPRLVQYSVLYTTNYASSTSNSFGLYRNVMDPTNTFATVIGSGQSLDSAWSAYGSTSNNLLVPNVVSMNVTLLTNYGAGTMTDGSGGVATSLSTTNSTNLVTAGTCVEISLTVMDDSALARFGSGNGVGNNSPASLMKSQGRTLVRRITLPSPP